MGFNYLTPKAETRHSTVSGKGTFTKEPINKGELIAVFGGKVSDFKTRSRFPDAVKKIDLQIHDNLHIGPTEIEDFGDGDFVNHCCEPNAGIKGQIFLVAMRDISKGEEITFDYAMAISGPEFKMKCICGSKNCRKVITSDDWRKPALQRKYKGYFSYYLQEKMKELGK